MEEVDTSDVQDLIQLFSKYTYKAKDNSPEVVKIVQKCIDLMELDYTVKVVMNAKGELATTYPHKLIILESEGTEADNAPYHGCNHWREVPRKDWLKQYFSRARLARCRARFPVPVILFKNKRVCRSATLSGGPEIYGRTSIDYIFSAATSTNESNSKEPTNETVTNGPYSSSEWQLYDKVRKQDIRLLEVLNVRTIIDLMVENKKVKFGLNVTSSEKVDKENRYSDFSLISLPYPGCEFFKEFHDSAHRAEDLVYEWNQAHVDANIFVPQDACSESLNIDWNDYRNWDLIKLTQNYLRLLICYLKHRDEGILVHCISGWDRTPLFISILRLSLWADGLIHKNLNPQQILYLTIAYDWMLFAHDLEDRLSKGEDIFYFCFYFLQHITNWEYTAHEKWGSPSEGIEKSKNDSDLHLEGILFGEDSSRASLDGSNWSIDSDSTNTSENCRQHKPVDDSWEECVQPHEASFDASFFEYDSNEKQGNECEEAHNNLCSQSPAKLQLNECLEDALRITDSGGFRQMCCTPRNLSTPIPVAQASNGRPFPSGVSPISNGLLDLKNSAKSSPVAVPNSQSDRMRPESTSSASIGSWQMIAGTESFRDTISDVGSFSTNFRCHDLETNLQDVTNSNYTLKEEPVNGGVTEDNQMVLADRVVLDEMPWSNSVYDGISIVTNNHEREDSAVVLADTNEMCSSSNPLAERREERLKKVSDMFRCVYSEYIQKPSAPAENGSSSLGSFIENFANRVGIRSTNRNNV